VTDGSGVMTSVRLRCVIERLADGSTWQPADSTTAELDSVADVPASMPFCNLPHFVLITFGYSTAESLACRGRYSSHSTVYACTRVLYKLHLKVESGFCR